MWITAVSESAVYPDDGCGACYLICAGTTKPFVVCRRTLRGCLQSHRPSQNVLPQTGGKPRPKSPAACFGLDRPPIAWRPVDSADVSFLRQPRAATMLVALAMPCPGLSSHAPSEQISRNAARPGRRTNGPAAKWRNPKRRSSLPRSGITR